jgi:hypothetical protein
VVSCRCDGCDGATTFYDNRWKVLPHEHWLLNALQLFCFCLHQLVTSSSSLRSLSVCCQQPVASCATCSVAELVRWKQVTDEAAEWNKQLGWPPDPMWTESNWPEGQPSLLLYQVGSAVYDVYSCALFLCSWVMQSAW